MEREIEGSKRYVLMRKLRVSMKKEIILILKNKNKFLWNSVYYNSIIDNLISVINIFTRIV